MLKIGLTGGIGSGKSVVAGMFEQLGAPVIDADRISHEITCAGSQSLKQISEQLGAGFITANGELDRKKLAQHVFEHPEKKTVLENILHPRIRQQMMSQMQQLDETIYVILVIPLLFETDFIELVDRTVVVAAPEELRLERVGLRDARSQQQIRAILKNQLDQSVKTEKADDVLDNSGTLEQLQTAVAQLHTKYLKTARGTAAG